MHQPVTYRFGSGNSFRDDGFLKQIHYHATPQNPCKTCHTYAATFPDKSAHTYTVVSGHHIGFSHYSNTVGSDCQWCRPAGYPSGSLLGSLEPSFLKLATYQQTLTELADTHSSSLELRSHVRLPKLDPGMCVPPIKWVIRFCVAFRKYVYKT